MPKETCQEIYKAYTVHEKKYGDRAGIEDVIVSKRKFQYEEVRRFVCSDCIPSKFFQCCNFPLETFSQLAWKKFWQWWRFFYGCKMMFWSGSESQPSQLRRLVWLPETLGKWWGCRSGQGSVRESYSQCSTLQGECKDGAAVKFNFVAKTIGSQIHGRNRNKDGNLWVSGLSSDVGHQLKLVRWRPTDQLFGKLHCRKRDTGGGTFICGLTTRCTKNWKLKTSTERDKSIKLVSSYCHTKNSPSPKSGCCLLSSKSDRKIWAERGKYWWEFVFAKKQICFAFLSVLNLFLWTPL